ncbi:MAG: hypothetical protein IPP79_12070 [Chitinophagaceae bacterium]|nr:hypothetical protein [Chitinophagaceae bacterium]
MQKKIVLRGVNNFHEHSNNQLQKDLEGIAQIFAEKGNTLCLQAERRQIFRK